MVSVYQSYKGTVKQAQNNTETGGIEIKAVQRKTEVPVLVGKGTTTLQLFGSAPENNFKSQIPAS